MATQLTQAFSFLSDHPKVSCLLLLLLTPPLFRILLYFTPLLLSTALCVFALISLSPYVTATDAEVERQSKMGASSSQANALESSNSERLVEAAARANITSNSSSSASVAASENSWLSWMKGLNDISRAWMESKLREEGFALSEPANRETLLALIEGSFAELVTAKTIPPEPFSPRDVYSAEAAGGDTMLASQAQEMEENVPDDGCGGVVEGFIKQGDAVESGVLSVGISEDENNKNVGVTESLVQEDCGEMASVRTPPRNVVHANAPSVQDHCDNGAKRRVKQTAYEFERLSSADGQLPKPPATVSRNPLRAPTTKLLEASRRIFTKEESKTVQEGAPASKLNLESSGSILSKGGSNAETPSSGTPLKPPPRKLLAEASRTVSSKDIESKAVMLTTNPVEAPASKLLEASRSAVSKDEDNEDGVMDDGPKFDDDLQVEEAQALVRSELKMLEMEIEEVAAKLPKLDEFLTYKKTPAGRVKREGTAASATTEAPTGSPLFPAFK